MMVGMLDNMMEDAHYSSSGNPMAEMYPGEFSPANQCDCDYRSPFAAAANNEEQLGRDLAPAAAILLGFITEKPLATRGAGGQFTRSTLRLGQQMHRAYKSDLVNGVTRFKEFRFETGRRADFIDFEEGIIYELKPNNPRAIREGGKQLQQYLQDAKEQFPGINWRTVLDTY